MRPVIALATLKRWTATSIEGKFERGKCLCDFNLQSYRFGHTMTLIIPSKHSHKQSYTQTLSHKERTQLCREGERGRAWSVHMHISPPLFLCIYTYIYLYKYPHPHTHNHRHLATSTEIDFATLFQNTLSVIVNRRLSLGMAVSLHIISEPVRFRDRSWDDRWLERRKDDTVSIEVRAQCTANWTHLFRTKLNILGRFP